MEERIHQILYKAIDEVNDGLPSSERIGRTPDTRLLGHLGALDSLGFAVFVTAVEEGLREEFGVPITLTDERALSGEDGPFQTLQTLAEYVRLLLEESASDRKADRDTDSAP